MHSDGGTDGAAVGLNLVSQNLPEKKELSRSKQERGPEGTVHTGVSPQNPTNVCKPHCVTWRPPPPPFQEGG